MGTTLTGTTPQDTYDSLIKVTDNGPLSGTAKYLSDGLGNDSILALSTARVGLGTATPDAMLTLNGTTPYIRIERTGVPTWQIQNNTLVADAGFSINNLTNAGTPFFINGTTNNVGIGTAAPSSKLHVFGSQAGASPTALLRVGNSGAGYMARIILTDETTADGNIVFQGSAVGSSSQYIGLGIAAIDTIKITGDSYLRMASGTGGIQFNGDTAAANALDDYEEGTFTPTIAGSTTAGTATYTTQVARYTKIGRQVSCQIDLGYNSGTGTGNLTIAGLPFTDAGLNNPAVTIGYLENITLTANNYALAYIASGTTRIDFVQIPTGGGALTSVAYDGEGRIILNVTYTA
jgi:hypothetical protein